MKTIEEPSRTMEEKYVISFSMLGQDHNVVWLGSTPNNALDSFWASFDEIDAKKVSNVYIFNLIPAQDERK